MFKKTTSSIACLTIMATSIGALNANASEQTEGSQKGTMGYGYQKYLKNHPNEQSNATSNRSTFSTKSKVITTQNGDRVLDISEWQGNLTDSQVKQLKKIIISSLSEVNMVLNMLINVWRIIQLY